MMIERVIIMEKMVVMIAVVVMEVMVMEVVMIVIMMQAVMAMMEIMVRSKKVRGRKRRRKVLEQGIVADQEQEQTHEHNLVRRKLMMVDVEDEYREAVIETGPHILFTDCAGHNKVEGAEKLALECFLKKPLTS